MTRRWLIALAALVILGSGTWWFVRAMPPTNVIGPSGGPKIPTAKVTRGPLDRRVTTTGELRATQSNVVMAPTIGGNLRIVQIAASGTEVKQGDVVVEMDPSEQEYQLEQSRSELEQAEQEITKRRADGAVQIAQDKVDLLTARFDVQRAELDSAADKDLIAANEYARRQLNLEEARRKLAQLEKDIQSRADAAKAGLTMLEGRRSKAELAATRAQQNIETLRITAPISGHVAARENVDAGGFTYGIAMPEYRAGDIVFAGRPLADVFDLSSLEIRVNISEPDRPSIVPGQIAKVESDALPGVIFEARVKTIAGIAQRTSVGPNRQFDAILDVVTPDPRLRPGSSVQVVLAAEPVASVLQLPVQAVRQKDGKPVVYVETPTGFEPRPINLLYRTESRAGFEGLDEGTVVALVDPEATPGAGQKPAAAAAPAPAPAGVR